MLKLDKSQSTNTIALHLATTASLSDVAFVYSQSYDLSNGTFFGDVTETKGKYRIVSISGSTIPAYSGQYDIEIYEATTAFPITWAAANFAWNNNPYTFNNAGTSGKTGDILRTIRAWVSGSNDVPTTSYVTTNEYGTYITYES